MAKKSDDLVIDEAPEPPQPPEPGRALAMRRPQLVTLVVLGAIIVSALAGLYNEQHRDVNTKVGGVDVRVQYTTRFRFQQTDIVSVMLHNTTSSAIDSVQVSIDTAYMAGFSEVTMVPEALFPYASQLMNLPPGEAREIRVEARGDRFGKHKGFVMIALHGDTTRVPISTFVIP